MPRDRSEKAIARARVARQDSSVAEEIVWNALRGNRLGFKFRREHPIDGYRLDFFCAEARLAVEMDGEQHDPSYDAVRDDDLARIGILTLRIRNREFFGLDEAPYRNELRDIQRLCEERSGRKAFVD